MSSGLNSPVRKSRAFADSHSVGSVIGKSPSMSDGVVGFIDGLRLATRVGPVPACFGEAVWREAAHIRRGFLFRQCLHQVLPDASRAGNAMCITASGHN